MIHFGIGWIFTFVVIFAINVYLAMHYLRISYKGDGRAQRRVKIIALCIHGVLAIVALVYFAFFFSGQSEAFMMRPMSYVAGIYLCMLFYMCGIFIFVDIVWLIRKLICCIRGLSFTSSWARSKRATLIVTCVCVILTISAFYTPTHITLSEYSLTFERGASPAGDIRIAFVSDTHIGAVIREKELDEIVRLVVDQQPDLVILGGDIFDEGTPEFLKSYTSTLLSDLTKKTAVYYILGNHDDYRGDTDAVLSYFERADVKVLLDDAALCSKYHAAADAIARDTEDPLFWLVGRVDNADKRTALSDIMATLDASDPNHSKLPVIIADHQPRTSEAQDEDRVALQLSGHTHGGQIFPAQILLPWSLWYGMHHKEGLDVIVSSGVGEFGVPVRLGSPAEVVILDISFK